MVRYQLVLSALVISTACAPPTGGPNNPGPLLCEVEADCLGAQTCVLGTGECRDLQAGECRRDDANLCACELNSHCPQGYRCGGSGLCEPENGGGGGQDAGQTPGTDAGTPGGGECEATSDCPIDQFCSPAERACAAYPGHVPTGQPMRQRAMQRPGGARSVAARAAPSARTAATAKTVDVRAAPASAAEVAAAREL